MMFLLTILSHGMQLLGRGLRPQRWILGTLLMTRTRLLLLFTVAAAFFLFPLIFSHVMMFQQQHRADYHLMLVRQSSHLLAAPTNQQQQPTSAGASFQASAQFRNDDAGDGAAPVLLMPSGVRVQKQAPAPAPAPGKNQQFHKDDQPAAPATLQPPSFKSSCSLAADLRGPHQKVIGYSIYGDFSQTATADRYLTPLAETLKDIALAYPGWIVRIHHNLPREENETSSWKMLEKAVSSAGNHVDLCNVTEIVTSRKMAKAKFIFPMTWRWLPVLDGLVDTFMSRDADSVILPRERDAVVQWLASNQSFHMMRDHPAHCIFMLGGLWGVKLAGDSNRRRQVTKAFERLFSQEKHVNQYNFDQRLLTKRIWPIAKSSHMAHDSYCCQKFKGSRPFPTQRSRQLTFVGGIQQKNQTIQSPCPKACRPVDVRPQWNYC
ncbi:uncharacterized protein LOC124326211 [Daphnia pulicaria]|uniref:uncharacterized protein LOC124326211 n=1 Tax=Daphnia pulicaria TaxID=35523 RepID=UPI001EEBE572|nr:uncharacterized protein LOC124326211 [Daphnia pulicaria]